MRYVGSWGTAPGELGALRAVPPYKNLTRAVQARWADLESSGA